MIKSNNYKNISTNHKMKPQSSPNYAQEFKELTSDISDLKEGFEYQDEVEKLNRFLLLAEEKAAMMHVISEERKSSNLVVKDIGSKFDQILSRLDRIATLLEEQAQNREENETIGISDRDEEIIEFIKTKKKVCADDLQDHFSYKGRNAASARLNKLFRDKLVEKIYAGKTVYYMMRNISHE
jgi:DNA repair exonuclease SbcCD nuclease subunit